MIILHHPPPKKIHIPQEKAELYMATPLNPSHNRETDGLEITEAKSQKIDHIQQNGRSD